MAGALSHSVSGRRHWGHCLPGQASLKAIKEFLSSTWLIILQTYLRIFSNTSSATTFPLLALYCGYADGGCGDQESPFHKSEQMVKKQTILDWGEKIKEREKKGMKKLQFTS